MTDVEKSLLALVDVIVTEGKQRNITFTVRGIRETPQRSVRVPQSGPQRNLPHTGPLRKLANTGPLSS